MAFLKFLLMLTLLKIASGVVIDCKYYGYDWNNWGEHYTCSARLEDVTTAGVVVTSATGDHRDGYDNSKVLAVEFHGQKTNYILQGLVEDFPSLKELYVFRSDLKEISKSDFTGYTQLTTVSLSRNHLQNVPKDAFVHLENLEQLSLSFNQLTSVPYLAAMPLLKELYLFENSIESLAASDFDSNTNLRTIWLYHNKIRFIEAEVFNGAHNLKTVDLRWNRCVDHEYRPFDNEEFSEFLKTSCVKTAEAAKPVEVANSN